MMQPLLQVTRSPTAVAMVFGPVPLHVVGTILVTVKFEVPMGIPQGPLQIAVIVVPSPIRVVMTALLASGSVSVAGCWLVWAIAGTLHRAASKRSGHSFLSMLPPCQGWV